MIGTTIDQYEVVDEIGRGGMGVVYLARQAGLERLVALKLLPFADHALADRLRREAATLADLQHPNVITVLSVGEYNGSPYYAMSYCPGGSLAQVTRTNGMLTTGQLVGLLAPTADALGTLHRNGVLHRDVKPSNVLLTANGHPLLSDFGLVVSNGNSRMTSSGNVMGTIGYSAPELLSGSSSSAASDVFAFGALAYELATGRQAFVGVHLAAVLDAVRSGNYVPVSSLAPHVDERLVAIIDKCLSPDPGSRPADLSGVANEIRGVGPSEPVTPVQRTESQTRTVAATRQDRNVTPKAEELERVAETPRKRRRTGAIVAGVGALAATVGLAAIVLGRGGDEPEALAVQPAVTVLGEVTLPAKTVDGVTAQTTWTLIDDVDGAIIRGSTLLSHELSERTVFSWDEVIPKQLATSAGDISSTPSPSSIVQDDPIIRYCLKLNPGEDAFISWFVKAATPGLDDATLENLAKAWSSEFDNHQANPGGEACTAENAVEATTATSTTVLDEGVEVALATTLPSGAGNSPTTSPKDKTTVSPTTGPTIPPVVNPPTQNPTPPPVQQNPTPQPVDNPATQTTTTTLAPLKTTTTTTTTTTIPTPSVVNPPTQNPTPPPVQQNPTPQPVDNPATQTTTTTLPPAGPTAFSPSDGSRKGETNTKNLATSRYSQAGTYPITTYTLVGSTKPPGSGVSISGSILSIYLRCDVPDAPFTITFRVSDGSRSATGTITVTPAANSSC